MILCTQAGDLELQAQNINGLIIL